MLTRYAVLDRPEILSVLFHPRKELPRSGGPGHDVLIPVAPDVAIGGRFHLSDPQDPILLFFHGNGEIVADYDDLGEIYARLGINFMAVDYRGYGRSSGMPTVTSLMADCHRIFEFVTGWCQEKGFRRFPVIMGRSLGSASALEVAAAHPERIGGLIVESGFAYATPLLRLLGVDAGGLGFREEEGFANLEKIRRVTVPTLVIHAERDHIIPFQEGEALFSASPAPDKTFLRVPDAGHNDILFRGLDAYLEAVGTLAGKTI